MSKFGEFCRICLKQEDGLINLQKFIDMDAVPLIVKLKTVYIQMVPDKDELPNYICSNCKYDLCVAYNFISKCQKSHRILIQCLAQIKLRYPQGSRKKIYITQIKSEKNNTVLEDPLAIKEEERNKVEENNDENKPIKFEEVTLPIKQEIMSDDEDKLNIPNITDINIQKTIDQLTDVDIIPLGIKKDLPTVEKETYGGLLLQTENIRPETTISRKRKKPNSNDNELVFCCNICNKMFSRSKVLTNHIKMHKKSKLKPSEVIFTCNICAKNFNSDQMLKEHLKSHENVYSCALCARSYKVRGLLARHLESHLTENDSYYSCDVCNEKFTNVRKFRAHTSSHCKMKPIKKETIECNICGENFEFKKLLIIHMRGHFEEEKM